MPIETMQAVQWALSQTYTDSLGYEYPVTKEDPIIVDLVRQYFNDHDIEYNTFSYGDLTPFLEQV